MKFSIKNTSDFARRAELQFDRGAIQTPAFMPVGTNGTVKGLTVEDLKSTGSEIILGNTYHLMLRPGDEAIRILEDYTNFLTGTDPSLQILVVSGLESWRFGKNN